MRLPLALLAWLAATAIAGAGLFDPDKPAVEVVTPLAPETFRDRIGDRIAMGNAGFDSKVRHNALAERDAILKQQTRSPADMIRLGILRLRLGEGDAGMNELRTAYEQNRRDYWALSALGTAHLQQGQAVEAAQYLEAARELSPGAPTLDAAAIAACDAEVKLAQFRRRELIGVSGGRRAPPAATVDDIFGVKFVGESGEYEAGVLAAVEKAKLPKDAIAIVQQLLLWLPGDARLLWLLGELYNASGDFDSALMVFNECLDSRRFDTPKLREHRQAVMAAIAARPAPPIAWLPGQTRVWAVGILAVLVLFVLLRLQYRQVVRRRLR